MDERLWIILEKVLGQEVPRSITGAAPVLYISVTGRDQKTFQEQIEIPSKAWWIGTERY